MDTHFMELWTNASNWLISHSPRIIAALLIFLIGRKIAKWISLLISKAASKSSSEQATNICFFKDVLYYLLYAVVIIAALAQLGISTTSFLAILGTMGLAIGLAFKDSLGNFASGVMIIFFKPIEYGDFISISGESGTVSSVGIFNTTIITPDDTKIIIPNSAITSGNIKNFTSTPNRRVEVKIRIAYSDDIQTAKAAISALFATDPRILKTPEPMVVVTNLMDNGVEISVRVWCVNADFWAVFFDMNEKVKEAVQRADLTIHIPTMMKMINN